MKVLIVHPHMSFGGGAEVVIAKLSRYLSKNGVENSVLTLSKPPKPLADGLQLITPGKNYEAKVRSENFFSALGTFSEIRALRSLIRKHADSFDLINVHNFPATWAMPRGKPCVWMCNEPPDLWGNSNPSAPLKMLRNVGAFFDKRAVNSVNMICVADEFNSRRVFERYSKASEIIPYGIDYKFFSGKGGKDEVQEEFGLRNHFVMLQVGWLSPAKNQLESVKAVQKLKETIPYIKLILVGAGVGSYKKTLKDYVATNGLADNVIFVDFQTREIIRSLYRAADIVVHPVSEQGGWLTPFEALCAEAPVIVSTRMTAANILRKENIGAVTDDLPTTVIDVYKRPDEYKKMASRGKKYVANNLSWESFGEKMLCVFGKLIYDS